VKQSDSTITPVRISYTIFVWFSHTKFWGKFMGSLVWVLCVTDRHDEIGGWFSVLQNRK